MQLFKVNEHLSISGEVYSNSKAWGHEVRAFWNGQEVAKNRVRYYNRTWERYQFETAFQGLMNQLDKESYVPWSDRVEFAKYIKNYH